MIDNGRNLAAGTPEGDPGEARSAATAVRTAGAAAGARRAIHGRQTPAPRMKPYRGPPMTLGNAAAAGVRLVVWCGDCRRQVEPDPAEMAERYGADMTVPDWHARLTCSGCGSRQVDFVVTGTELWRPLGRAASGPGSK
jgi:hypothetical protein